MIAPCSVRVRAVALLTEPVAPVAPVSPFTEKATTTSPEKLPDPTALKVTPIVLSVPLFVLEEIVYRA